MNLLIAVGSTNPVKVQAVKQALAGENVRILPYAASSEVSAQPLSDEETRTGAIQRAQNCLDNCEADLAIGLEAGVSFHGDNVYLSHWGALVHERQKFTSNGPQILLPRSFQKELLAGRILEELMHEKTGIESLGKKAGAIAVFTGNRVNREQMLTQIVQVLIGQYLYYRDH